MHMTDFTREALAIRRQMRALHAKGYERISCAHGVGKLWELDRGARYRWKIIDAVIGLDGKSVFVKAEPPHPSPAGQTPGLAQPVSFSCRFDLETKMTVWVYTNGIITKVFATEQAAQDWFDKNDPEGVAFEHEVME